MAQIEKNTVEATNQLKDQYVYTHGHESAAQRILFVGNSITLHGIKHDIGWHNEWGMAASSEENDYVHQVMKGLADAGINAVYCICQVAEWETKYKTGSQILDAYKNARDFGADIIVMRCVENCPYDDLDADVFEREYRALIDYLNPEGTAKVILTTGFWKHPGDAAILKTAKDRGYPCIELGDLGEDNAMKAIGLFEHGGVQNHPGDDGMKAIADRILTELK